MAGKVYLIGMGPGDPELITLKAIKAIQKCDVLVYDRLVNQSLLSYNKQAERIYVGKTSGIHTMKQEDINELLAVKALEGHTVGRLKGGDPFVFGRGGEEALHLKARGVQYDIVPGITSAIAVPMYANIPVTHRGIATSFHVITGHEQSEDSNIDWKALAHVRGTLVFLMGIENLEMITERLKGCGKAGSCPAAVIMNGTREDQRQVCGTLDTISEKCRQAGIKSPAIIVIGEVVSLHGQIDCKSSGELAGLTVVSTRPEEKSGDLTEKLRDKGARVIKLPCIEIAGIKNVEIARDRLEAFDGIIFSSTYGARYFMEALRKNRIDMRSLRGRIYAVGPSVKAELEAWGVFDCTMPQQYSSEALAELIKAELPESSGLLIVSGNIGGERLLDSFRAYDTEKLTVYDTLEGCGKALEEPVDAIVFTSPSCVRGFRSKNNIEKYRAVPAVCIGESTGAEAEKAGFENIWTLENAIPELVIEKLIEWRSKNA